MQFCVISQHALFVSHSSSCAGMHAMVMINWLCLCFYLTSPTNNESKSERFLAFKSQKRFNHWPDWTLPPTMWNLYRLLLWTYFFGFSFRRRRKSLLKLWFSVIMSLVKIDPIFDAAPKFLWHFFVTHKFVNFTTLPMINFFYP